MNRSNEHPPPEVLRFFAPHTQGLTWRRAPQGFSGAVVWRGEADGTARVALKAWPVGITSERLQYVHGLIRQAACLEFVPTVFASRSGATNIDEAGRMWDASRWMPGAPRLTPSEAEITHACAAVGQLHAVWADSKQRGPCPSVRTRLRLLTENAALIQARPETLPPVTPELNWLLRDAQAAVAQHATRLASKLQLWLQTLLALHPCIRDLRGEHVLFEGDRVSGIIDYGAAAVDHAAVDLARLLTDLAGNDNALWQAGLRGYRSGRGPCDMPEELVLLLGQTGVVCSLLGWVMRCVSPSPPAGSPAAIAARIQSLLSMIHPVSGI